MLEILQIEDESFAWTEEEFLRFLRQRNCIGMVAEAGVKVVGCMVYELQPNKIQLVNLTVGPKWLTLLLL